VVIPLAVVFRDDVAGPIIIDRQDDDDLDG